MQNMPAVTDDDKVLRAIADLRGDMNRRFDALE